MKFVVTLQKGEDGFIIAECPALPGCITQGRTNEEALANIRKHAAARNAWITFSRPTGDRLQLFIKDDGRGFDPAAQPDPQRKSFGLASMRERVESLGGELMLESQPGTGARVRFY